MSTTDVLEQLLIGQTITAVETDQAGGELRSISLSNGRRIRLRWDRIGASGPQGLELRIKTEAVLGVYRA